MKVVLTTLAYIYGGTSVLVALLVFGTASSICESNKTCTFAEHGFNITFYSGIAMIAGARAYVVFDRRRNRELGDPEDDATIDANHEE